MRHTDAEDMQKRGDRKPVKWLLNPSPYTKGTKGLRVETEREFEVFLRENCWCLKVSSFLWVEISFPGWWYCLNYPETQKGVSLGQEMLGRHRELASASCLDNVRDGSCSLGKGSQRKISTAMGCACTPRFGQDKACMYGLHRPGLGLVQEWNREPDVIPKDCQRDKRNSAEGAWKWTTKGSGLEVIS